MRSMISSQPVATWDARWARTGLGVFGAALLMGMARSLPMVLGTRTTHETLEVALQWRPASGWYGLDVALAHLFTQPLVQLLPRAGAILLLAFAAAAWVLNAHPREPAPRQPTR